MLDLVALGTVADLAPLVGENRALVRKGLADNPRDKTPGTFFPGGSIRPALAAYHSNKHWVYSRSTSECRREAGICPGRL